MNCKPGDLAICIASPAWPEFVGRVFTITAPCQVHPNHWDTDPPQFIAGFKHPCSFDDSTVRPLRGVESADETLTWAGKPWERQRDLPLQPITEPA